MNLCTFVQEGGGYKDTLSAHRYYALLAKYFIVCITYQENYVCLLPNILRAFDTHSMCAACRTNILSFMPST